MRSITTLLLLFSLTACDDTGGETEADPRASADGGVDAIDAAEIHDAGHAETDAAALDPDAGFEPSISACFGDKLTGIGPDYDGLEPVVGSHCAGTDHQDIRDVERVVFLGDSVTAGTPPSRVDQVYRTLVGEGLQERFGADITLDNCAEWGARTDDFLIGQSQVAECFPEVPDARTTLVIFTIGGNDMFRWAERRYSVADAIDAADEAADLLYETLAWFKAPGRFPGGAYVVFANPYEYTDGTGDLESCLAAGIIGVEGNWIEGAPAVAHFQERFLEMAIEFQVDMVFALEHFCGHGFHNENPESPCYQGPDTPRWFDGTCIHPNPAGHAALAEFFLQVIDE